MGVEKAVLVLRVLSLIPSQDLILLAIAFMAANMLALTFASLLSDFAEDFRSAQTLVGNFYILIFIPAFMLMFSDKRPSHRCSIPAKRSPFHTLGSSHSTRNVGEILRI
jgi:ABC-type Na+ efflux pump permease subunit